MTAFLCPVHGQVQQDLDNIQEVQRTRPCTGHEERLKTAETTNKEQWEAINSLRKMVYMGAGATAVLAFLGSILGAFLKR